jgi:hypothetical protein
MRNYLILLLLIPVVVFGNQGYIKLSDQISDKFIKDYCERTGVTLSGCGGGMMDDIDLICLTFVGQYRLDVPAARRLYVDGVEDLLHRYNSSKIVRPYLHNFPFKINNLVFLLGFEDPSGKHVPSNFVGLVLCTNGKVDYSYYDPITQQFMDLHEETYEEALRIVHAEREQRKTASAL